jgi:hypothetical protein
MENKMTIKRSYVDPKDAPPGVPCRFCDMPAGVQGLGQVYLDGTAVDGKRPLYSHGYCLMNSGGFKQDDYDFSLQDLLPKDLISPYSNNLTVYKDQPMQISASLQSDEDNIWAFASKMRYIAHTDMNNVTETAKKPNVKEMTTVNSEEQYSDPNTGASQPPSN